MHFQVKGILKREGRPQPNANRVRGHESCPAVPAHDRWLHALVALLGVPVSAPVLRQPESRPVKRGF